jgi:hypothetical protein
MLNFKEYVTEMKISLEYHNQLNPQLWSGDKLKSSVRTSLLKFIDAWREYANIPKSLVQDIIMTGGNANYNYTSKSDIDVHLIVDRNRLGPNRAMIDDYLQDKKVLWTMTHKINVYGYPLEPYAQDPVKEYPKGQGIYSLKFDKWVQKPMYGNYDFKNDKILKQKVSHYMHTIDKMIKSKMDLDKFKHLKDKIRDMRGAAIQKGGEFSHENLVFKELRNRGYLDKMSKYEKTLQDRSLSLS